MSGEESLGKSIGRLLRPHAGLDRLRSRWSGVGHHGGHHGGRHGGHHGGHHARDQAVVSDDGGLQRDRASTQYFMWRKRQLTVGSLRLVVVAALSVKNSCEMSDWETGRLGES